MRSSAVVVAVSVVVLAGCGGGVAGDEGEPQRAVEGAWRLVSGTGPDGVVAAPPGSRITLVVEAGTASGTAACNQYGGVVRVDRDRFAIAELSSTEMACERAVMAAEAAYLGALRRVDTVHADRDRLVLRGGSTELTFAPLPPVPTASLVGSEWRLETVLDGETAMSTLGAAALKLTGAGAIEGSTGCRRFAGRYVVRGDEVVATELTAHDDPAAGACPPDVVRQDGIVLSVLGDGFQATVEGDRLTLRSGRSGLVYRPG